MNQTSSGDLYVNPYGDQVFVHTFVQVWTTFNAVVGTVGNVMVIAAVALHHKLRNIGNLFIINLAVADLGVSIVVNLASVVGSITNESGFFFKFDWLCEIIAIICIVTCSCSLWSIAAIAFNRYVWICHWHSYHKVYNQRTVPPMLASLWLISFLIDVPNLMGWGIHTFDWKVMSCSGGMAFVHSYAVFFAVSTFAVPLFVITYSYIGIYRFAKKTSAAIVRMRQQNRVGPTASRRGVNAISGGGGAPAPQAAVRPGHNRIGNGARQNDLRLARSVLIIVIMYLIMWMPFSLTILFDTQIVANRNIYIFAFTLAHMNSSMNCVIYGSTNQQFRHGYAKFVKLLICRRPKRFDPNHSVSGTAAVMAIHNNEPLRQVSFVEHPRAVPTATSII